MNDIRLISFCGKFEEWDTWSERFLAKAKRSELNNLLLGKLSIPKLDEEIDETTDNGKKKSMLIVLNEIVYTELILLIDVNTSSGKVAFNIIRGFKTKDYPDSNGAIAWERINNKYKPASVPSMVKLEK
jgi:hypothetical protein